MVGTAPVTRRTAQKDAVWQALESSPGFVSAQDLHQQLVAAGASVGLATVYRQLAALAAEGRADTIPDAGGLLYRVCAPGGHHHHLVCESCGKAVEIQPPLEDWIRKVARDSGYTVSRHVLEVFGTCPECAASN